MRWRLADERHAFVDTALGQWQLAAAACPVAAAVAVAIASAEQEADSLAVDDTTVYFVANPQPTMREWNDLWSAPLAGGTATRLGTTGESRVTPVSVNATAIFTFTDDQAIQRWPKDGGAPTVLYQEPFLNLTQRVILQSFKDAFGHIYFVDDGDSDTASNLSRIPKTAERRRG